MLSTLAAIRRSGIDARPLDIWSRDADFDILHVWGLEISQGPAVRWARKSGKLVVMTALLPYATIPHRLYYLGSSLFGTVKLRRDVLEGVDVLVVLNRGQADAAENLLRIAPGLVRVIPNVVESAFFEAANEPIAHDLLGAKAYLLCAGNICRRKNQVTLARAALAVGCRLLIAGDVLAGEEAYAATLSRTIEGRADVTWVRGLPPGSPELIALFQKCGGFALPSFSEQQPLSALEAAVLGKPLLLGDRVYARQPQYTNARLVDPTSVAEVAKGLRDILDYPARHVPPSELLDECRADRVGAAYSSVFTELIGTREERRGMRLHT
jgi:glycosyltransferase involved in cell wall biosynthesis